MLVHDTRRLSMTCLLPFPNACLYLLTQTSPLLGLGGLLRLGDLLLALVLLDELQQRGWVGADKLVDLLAVLEDGEGGHGAHAVLLGDVGEVVDVDLGEVDLCDFVGPPEQVCLC